MASPAGCSSSPLLDFGQRYPDPPVRADSTRIHNPTTQPPIIETRKREAHLSGIVQVHNYSLKIREPFVEGLRVNGVALTRTQAWIAAISPSWASGTKEEGVGSDKGGIWCKSFE